MSNVIRIMDYQPDRAALKTKFRPWHVEALLNQAADLMDKCLGELREYAALNYAWNQFSIDLMTLRKELDLDIAHKEDYKRDKITVDAKQKFFTDSQSSFDAAKAEAAQLHSYKSNEGQGNAGWTRAAQNYREKLVEDFSRNMEKTLADLHVAWFNSDVGYNESRLEIREGAVKEKEDRSVSGQPLALNWQSELVWIRLKRDYEDALNRACIAEEGLERFYGHKPDVSVLPGSEQPMEAAISHLEIWIRKSIEWLVAYQQREQAFTRVVSIRSLLTKETWNSLKEAKDHFETSLTIPAALFSNHDNTRLRGIGASFIGDVGDVPWSLIVRVPKEAIYQRNGQSINVIQGDLPSCFLGRVENRKAVRLLEISGVVSLMNASPIGRLGPLGSWSLEMFRPSGTAEEFSEIEDVLLEISVVGQPK